MIYTGNLYIPNYPSPSTFGMFLQTLPPWKSELLYSMEIDCDAFTISKALSHGLRAVSDGSVWDDHQGAFGWAISTDIGDRVAKGMGPARGATPDSFRAEAYGMLAVLSFLQRLAEFTGQHEPWVGVLATDSQRLLDTILAKTCASGDNHPNVKTLQEVSVESPEWDLVSSVIVHLHSQPGLTLQYVRGHQDRTVAYDNLSLLAQLNVDADEMATKYQITQGGQRPIAFLTDTASVNLVTPNGSVTSKFGVALRFQATYGPLLQYIEDRQGWTPQVTQTINWKAHSTSLKKRVKHRTHYIKLIHGILPTGKQMFRADPVRSLCSACKTRCEDWSHILLCSATSRENWRTETLDAVAAICRRLGTRPLLRRVLLAGLEGWLKGGFL
jgi:hypothetical protein